MLINGAIYCDKYKIIKKVIHISTCITGFEKEPSELNIGILGYNNELSEYGFRQIIENNKEQVNKISKNRRLALLKDGTRLDTIISPDWHSLQGCRFDQLILFDDNRWLIYSHRNEDIYNIKKFTMMLSNVPEEFQILNYEDIR